VVRKNPPCGGYTHFYYSGFITAWRGNAGRHFTHRTGHHSCADAALLRAPAFHRAHFTYQRNAIGCPLFTRTLARLALIARQTDLFRGTQRGLQPLLSESVNGFAFVKLLKDYRGAGVPHPWAFLQGWVAMQPMRFDLDCPS
jgi:hypothetical protein